VTGAAIFLYGTLLDVRVLARRSGDARLARRRPVPAALDGHCRVVLRATPYPTLVPGPGIVQGVLLRPTAEALRRLATYEGPPIASCRSV